MHFAPSRNWMNDPNGLVFHDGRHHLFFQYNPEGIEHANMSWGHASSPDLVRWEEHPVAIRNTASEQIFSGSAVVDHHNTSGLGSEEGPALVAFYTAHSELRSNQSQHVAYSLDGGLTWRKYGHNPVLDRDSSDFRDPKVFWYDGPAGSYWVMAAVEAVRRQVVLHRSDDLITWTHLSDFGPVNETRGIWECPDLFPLALDGDPDDMRWVMLISIGSDEMPGGSATQYLTGHFDGAVFTPDQASGEVRWLDHGRDCYAGVTFSGLPDDQRTLIAWMSNWDYAREFPFDPAAPRRGRMTLPRRLSLVTVDGAPRLRQEALGPELTQIESLQPATVESTLLLSEALPDQGRLRLVVRPGEADGFELRLGATLDEAVVLRFDPRAGLLEVDRRAGTDVMPALFGSVEQMPVTAEGSVELEIWLGERSVEVFAEAGTSVLTDLTALRPGPRAWLTPAGGAVRLEEFVVNRA